VADLHTSSDRPQFRTRKARRHEWHAVLATLETDPHDADALLAALRTPPLDHEFANVSPDALDGASALVNAARAALTAQFGEPHPLRDGSAVAFMGDSDEWVIAGALRVNPDWPSHGSWHQQRAGSALAPPGTRRTVRTGRDPGRTRRACRGIRLHATA
jgi:hypothetical protein